MLHTFGLQISLQTETDKANITIAIKYEVVGFRLAYLHLTIMSAWIYLWPSISFITTHYFAGSRSSSESAEHPYDGSAPTSSTDHSSFVWECLRVCHRDRCL